MVWSKQDILSKVEARAAALGKSLTQALPAGYASFFTPSKFQRSPTIETLEKIANALGWTLCDLMCDPTPGVISEDLLKHAIQRAVRAVGDRPELLTDAIFGAYEVLAAVRSEGRPIDEAALANLEVSIRVQHRGR